MADLDDLMLEGEMRQDLVRLLPNIHDLIAVWRAQIVAGDGTFGANCTQAARSLLGRLLRIFNFATNNSTAFNTMLANIGVARSGLNTRVTVLRDALRIFRDASKTNASEITAAINALEAAIPARRTFLDQAIPSDW